MKKLSMPLLVIVFISLTASMAFSQSENRPLRRELKSKPPKEVTKEAKRLKKANYQIAPGALPLEKQLQEAYYKQLEKDEDGNPRYYVETGNSVGKTQTAAKIQAMETAKLQLAGAIQTNVAALIENNIGNAQLSTEEAESVTQTVAASKNIIAQELGRTMTIVELYRDKSDGVEASIRLAYDTKIANEAAKKVIRKQLEDKAEELQGKLGKLLNF